MKRYFILMVVTFFGLGFLAVITASAQNNKCPEWSKCLTFTGPDTHETAVQITDGAQEVLRKYNITVENNGTKLVFLDDCDTSGICGSIDLTGRRPGVKTPMESLNQKITMTRIGPHSVKLEYVEFDGDSGTYYINRGKFTETAPKL